MKAIIFDIDGTLADCTHRKHYIEKSPKDWDSFYSDKEIMKDKPIAGTLELLQSLNEITDFVEGYCECCCGYEKNRYTIILVSGRRESTRYITIQWLMDNGVNNKLFMRKDGDHRPDCQVKEEILKKIQNQGYEIICVIDDRKQCVDMWRRNGLLCLQCAEGNF